MNENKALSEWTSIGGDPASDGAGAPDVVFAHVSDLHGQLTPRYQVYFDNPTSKPDFDFGDDDRVIERGGGIPLLAAKLDELREDHDVRTLMSGDTFHGSAVTTYTDGRAMLDPINDHVVPDVYVPGNWDYSNEAAEEGNFVDLMDGLDAPILANNLYNRETDERLYDAYRILDVGGLSVGVVGMTNVYVDRMAPAFYEGKYRFGKHLALLEESAQAAREEGADVVIAATEIGLPWMVQAAKDCASVDVMFSAHTHEYTYDPIVIEETETVIVEYLDEHSPVDYEVMGLVETADDGGRAQNTPADGPYPFIQPGIDYTDGEAYCETSMIPRGNAFPEEGRNRTR
ncbi:metallophosphoesterase [Halorubrum sp. DTA98]|uniref:metallophosphoesterase n=1 Tax=Halorubrum sp. DTA98 TaxID=3402163 RepID=UPI003AB00C3F